MDDIDANHYVTGVAASHVGPAPGAPLHTPTHAHAAPAGGSVFAGALSDHTINVYDVTSVTPRVRLVGHTDRVTDITFAGAAGDVFMSSSCDGTVKVWDARTGRGVAEVRGVESSTSSAEDAGNVNSVSVGCGGLVFACAVDDGVSFFDPRTYQRIGGYRDNHTDTVTCARFNPDPTCNTQLLTAGDDGLVCLYDTTQTDPNSALLSVMNTMSPVNRAGFFGPQGQGVYVLASSETLGLWHTPTSQCIADYTDIRERLGCDYLVDCHSDEALNLNLMCGKWNGDALVAEVTNTAVLPRMTLTGGHTATVRGCCRVSVGGSVSGPGSGFVTCGEDARICVWNPRQPQGSPSVGSSAKGSAKGKSKSKQRRDGSGRDRHKPSPY